MPGRYKMLNKNVSMIQSHLLTLFLIHTHRDILVHVQRLIAEVDLLAITWPKDRLL